MRRRRSERRAGTRAAALWCLAAALAVPALSPEQSRSAQKKLESIADGRLAPGSTVALHEDEINSYLRYDFASEIPAGISEPRFRFETDRVIGAAVVDFAEFQAQRGEPPGPLLAWLLRGKRRVEAACHYTSAGGSGRADVEWARIGGIPISGSMVHFLIEYIVQPRYPPAVVGRSQPLGYNLEQVRFERGRVVAKVSRK